MPQKINKIYDKSAYNDGFMLGYIINGKTKNIVQKINDKISITYSTGEHLTKKKDHYLSSYPDNGKRKHLYHIFLDFSAII